MLDPCFFLEYSWISLNIPHRVDLMPSFSLMSFYNDDWSYQLIPNLCKVFFVREIIQFFSNFGTDRIGTVISVLDSIDRISIDSHESRNTFPCVVNKFSISVCNTRTKFP